ncbi:GNAT family N-acetyltransferase [Microbacterium sp. NPDC089189]|uniref:GNAT family N-acetyltransferase n=1 Tax=Microbacterium sp. NPDC089189 TaxID=3154972 RepID=UPI003422534F
MDVTLQLFDSADVPEWIRTQRAAYVAHRRLAGDDAATAEANAQRSYERLFPDGRPVAGHEVFRVLAEGDRPVGHLWLGPHPDALGDVLYVWDIEIDDAERGRGFGRAAMTAAEERARERGARAIALNVFGFNATARALYESLGYQPTAIQMRKELSPPSPA